MFANYYKQVYDNKKSIQLKRIIESKSKLSYDEFKGSVSSSFFPFNILILPFIPIIVIA